MNIESFGRVLRSDSDEFAPYWLEQLKGTRFDKPFLAIGNSRSYGDVGLLTNGQIISTRNLNKLISFDSDTGILECEPGVQLREIQSIFVKRGWMLAVTPGTSLVTVAGAIANDVHGKDHHEAGTFGDHVVSLNLIRSNGEQFICSRESNADLLKATIGGLGLTGIILSAKIQLRRTAGPYFDAEVLKFDNISEFFDISQQTEDENWRASVAWFDCSTSKVGRGSYVRGNPSDRPYDPKTDDKKLSLSDSPISIPFTPPISLINKVSLDAFNVAYFHYQKMLAGSHQMHYKEFYYPLDGVGNWNRIYGPRGFYQYQSVVPMENAPEVTAEMLRVIKTANQGSFLGVLKTFADKKPAGLLSFAKHGVTLALDFPNKGESTLKLMNALDRIVADAGGRLNPSKDGRMPREMFQDGFPGIEEFLKFRDPNITSDFARRLID